MSNPVEGWGLDTWDLDDGWGIDSPPSSPSVPASATAAFVETLKCCTIKGLMPPIYKLSGDPIARLLCVIGTSDNDIGGQAGPVTCPV